MAGLSWAAAAAAAEAAAAARASAEGADGSSPPKAAAPPAAVPAEAEGTSPLLTPISRKVPPPSRLLSEGGSPAGKDNGDAERDARERNPRAACCSERGVSEAAARSARGLIQRLIEVLPRPPPAELLLVLLIVLVLLPPIPAAPLSTAAFVGRCCFCEWLLPRSAVWGSDAAVVGA